MTGGNRRKSNRTIPNREAIYSALGTLFDRAYREREGHFLTALIPTEVKDIEGRPQRYFNMMPDSELQELCEFCNQFKKDIHRRQTRRKHKVRLMLSIYCRIMEGFYHAAVIRNLLSILGNMQSDWTFPTQKDLAATTYGAYPWERYEHIELLANAADLEIGSILQGIWNRHLRNSFSHSQYMILPSGEYVGTKPMSPLGSKLLKRSERPKDGINPYWFPYEDIVTYYEASSHLLFGFIEAHRCFIEPFKNGRSFTFYEGKVRWDSSIGAWR